MLDSRFSEAASSRLASAIKSELRFAASAAARPASARATFAARRWAR